MKGGGHMKVSPIEIKYVKDTDVFRCECLDCRFNAMNLYRDSKSGLYCAFRSISIGKNVQCEQFEDCSDHGETPFGEKT